MFYNIMESWANKYTPKKINELLLDVEIINSIKSYLLNFPKTKKPVLLLYGPTGSGKTSAAYAFAHEMNCELIEVNASDCRNAEQIRSIVGNASKQMSLFMKRKLILIDELDGLSGHEDRGGVQEILTIFGSTKFPIICTANDPFDKSLAEIRKKSLMIEINNLDYSKIFNVLKGICEKENISYDETALKQLARQADGDLRAAINDLQSLAAVHKHITTDSISTLSFREKTSNIIDALLKIFKTSETSIARTALDDVDEEFEKIVLWIDENLPKEYEKPNELESAYNFLSRSNVYQGRIRKNQYWRLLVYATALITAGVAVSKDQKYRKFVSYKPTTRILALWKAKMKYYKRKDIAEKIAQKTHISKHRAVQEILPYIQQIMKKDLIKREEFVSYFDFSDEEVTWMVTH